MAKTTNIDTQGVVNHDIKRVDVQVLSRLSQINGRVMHGDAVLNLEKNRFEFVQRIGSRRKNRVLARTHHTTFRETLSGVRATIVFDLDEKYIKEELLAELRECFKKLEGSKI